MSQIKCRVQITDVSIGTDLNIYINFLFEMITCGMYIKWNILGNDQFVSSLNNLLRWRLQICDYKYLIVITQILSIEVSWMNCATLYWHNWMWWLEGRQIYLCIWNLPPINVKCTLIHHSQLPKMSWTLPFGRLVTITFGNRNICNVFIEMSFVHMSFKKAQRSEFFERESSWRGKFA